MNSCIAIILSKNTQTQTPSWVLLCFRTGKTTDGPSFSACSLTWPTHRRCNTTTHPGNFPPNTTASPPGWYKGKADRHTPSESESCTTAQPFVSNRSPLSTSRWMEKFMAGGRHFLLEQKKTLGKKCCTVGNFT